MLVDDTLATRRVAPRPAGVGRKNEGRVSDPPGYIVPFLASSLLWIPLIFDRH